MHKNKFILGLFLLAIAFTSTNGMEIVPSSKKFEKTDNFIRNYSKTDKDLEFPINSQPTINPRPTIKAKMYIIDRAYYAGSEELKYMNEAGIKSSIQNQQKMPLIPIEVIAEKRYWRFFIPDTIEKHLATQMVPDHVIDKKTFPPAIPADLIYECNTGDSLSFTIHGYPVTIKCCNNPATNLSFKDDFARHITDFTQKPYYHHTCLNQDDVRKELKEAGLINGPNCYFDENQLTHGIKGFVTINKLILDDKNISCIFRYLKQREIGHDFSNMNTPTK